MTPKEVFGVCAAAYRPKRRPNFILNPATGALEVTPDGLRKGRKAVRRAARRIVYRLYLAKALLYPELLWLKGKRTALEVGDYLRRKVRDLRFR